MGKSPGKWIKTVFFGKKSSKSNLSRDATSEIKISVTGKAPSKDFGADSMVISSPVCPVIDSTEHTELEKSSSANLITDTPENLTSTMDLTAITGEELIKLEQAATKAQAAFRGYLARRAFWALKGIIRLQALVRGHLVRRQAVATLKCMRAIIEFQALARGRKVRLSATGQLLQKQPSREFGNKKPSELLLTSIKEEKLSTNVFATKLVASSNTTMPLSFQYEPLEPNSVKNWLEIWSASHFWVPLPQPKKTVDSKPKRKQTKLHSEETETGRPKRSVRRVPDNNLSNSSENEKSRRTVRKFSNHQTEPVQPVQEQSLNELEKVKRNLRKISLSASAVPEKSEIETEKTEIPPPAPIQETTINGSNVENVKEPEPLVIENKPVDDVADEQPPSEPISMEVNHEEPAKVEVNGNSNGKEDNGVKENQKTRRRKSLPAKQEYNESASPNTPTLPSYMAATESAKAKLRAQAAAKAAEDAAAENGGSRRQSLSSGGKPSLPSPRVQKPVIANGKGGSKPNKSQISPRDEKVMQAGWKR